MAVRHGLVAVAGVSCIVGMSCGDPMAGWRFACDPDGPSTCLPGYVCLRADPGHAYRGVCTREGEVADPGRDFGDDAPDNTREGEVADPGRDFGDDAPDNGDTSDAFCLPQDHQGCVGGNLYWFDSCGNQGSLAETCGCGCTGGSCDCCPDWNCGDWSVCTCGNVQTRTCTDVNGCGTTAGKPAESQTCDHCGNGVCDCGETTATCGKDCPCKVAECPVVSGYTVSCNEKGYCEYTGGPDPDMIWVPGGTFWMGCNAAVDGWCDQDEVPYHEVTLNGYWVDKFEVTQSAFKACRDSTKCKEDPACDWDPARKGKNPAVCITWSMAEEYCQAVGRHLCTEAQWERAARGTDGRKFPWSSGGTDCPSSWGDKCSGAEWTRETAKANCHELVCNDGNDGTVPVGSFPAGSSAVGALDMAGNVWEWVADWYGSDYYCKGPAANTSGSPWTYCGGAPVYQSPWTEPQGPPGSGSDRVIRGGSFGIIAGALRASIRVIDVPAVDYAYLGSRCCRSP